MRCESRENTIRENVYEVLREGEGLRKVSKILAKHELVYGMQFHVLRRNTQGIYGCGNPSHATVAMII